MLKSFGFILLREKLNIAIAAIDAAGLPQCLCESLLHRSDPETTIFLPVHFDVPSSIPGVQLLYLCPDDLFLNLIPLTEPHPLSLYALLLPSSILAICYIYTQHSNPAELEWTKPRINLRNDEPSYEGPDEDMYTVNALTGETLIKLLLLLSVYSPSTRRGFIFTWELSLLMFDDLVNELPDGIPIHSPV